MGLFRRDNASSELPASQVEYQEASGRHWPTLLIYIILALAVATLVVLGGRWAYDKLSKTDENPVPAQSQEEKEKLTGASESEKNAKENAADDANKPGASSEDSERSNASDSSDDSTSRSEGNEEATNPSPTPSSLPNNGPTEVLAVFVGSSIVAAGLHYVVNLRRSESI